MVVKKMGVMMWFEDRDKQIRWGREMRWGRVMRWEVLDEVGRMR